MNSRIRFMRDKVVLVGLLAVVVSFVAAVAATAAFAGAKSEHWGVIPRNTIGSPVGDLRDGPYGSFGHTGPTSEPPFGKGSLGIEVADKATSLAAPQEKVAFGNEVDFFGDPLLDLTAVGFRVFQTGENVSYGAGSAGTTSGCNQTTTCTFTQLKTALNDGGDAPVVYTVAVAKGRDNMWIGAVDGLRLNTKVYDFERDGVKERGA